ncbi:MAG: hypothetical protein KAS54_09755, partial [Dehalococcoidia bacterium]|nr:hypothetical protein [Dehalococcoidia bacterium]
SGSWIQTNDLQGRGTCKNGAGVDTSTPSLLSLKTGASPGRPVFKDLVPLGQFPGGGGSPANPLPPT